MSEVHSHVWHVIEILRTNEWILIKLYIHVCYWSSNFKTHQQIVELTYLKGRTSIDKEGVNAL